MDAHGRETTMHANAANYGNNMVAVIAACIGDNTVTVIAVCIGDTVTVIAAWPVLVSLAL